MCVLGSFLFGLAAPIQSHRKIKKWRKKKPIQRSIERRDTASKRSVRWREEKKNVCNIYLLFTSISIFLFIFFFWNSTFIAVAAHFALSFCGTRIDIDGAPLSAFSLYALRSMLCIAALREMRISAACSRIKYIEFPVKLFRRRWNR